MSGYPGGSREGNSGLDSLFAQLRQSQNKPVTLEPSYSYYSNEYQQPSVSSAMPTPPIFPNTQPRHDSEIMSPVDTPAPRVPSMSRPVAERTTSSSHSSNLLNLLKFSTPSSSNVTSASTQPAIGTPLPTTRHPSEAFYAAGPRYISDSGPRPQESDLLATLMGAIQPKPLDSPQIEAPVNPVRNSFGSAPTPPAPDTQAYLLSLLNQPKPPQSEASLRPSKSTSPPSRASPVDDVGHLAQALEDASLDMSMMGSAATENLPSFVPAASKPPAGKNGLFTYVSPFDQMPSSAPRNRKDKPESSNTASPVPAFQILKHPGLDSPSSTSYAASPAHKKQKIDPITQDDSAPPTPLADGRSKLEALIGIGASGNKDTKENKETVHAALGEIGDQVDKQVQEAIALAEAEETVTSIEDDLKAMLQAKTEKEFQQTAQAAAKSIKVELEKDENSGALDDLPEPVAEEVKHMIDDAAQGHIIDSWESADADDTPIKDDEDSIIKVYSFPMKPWTSITIKEPDEPRPTFRDESVMDIARLKKEFDQIDRTLVTASNNFIVYGMSKNGGVRIIRQDDGKDARIFTETKDRVFSVVTSASAPDQKESIIATGISGTVYWAMIKDGEGDHVEDSNPEMYGFALPPIQTLESESPGGMLKTRARKSSSHPDFFAVGRGKFIHIIWPSVILKQSFLKNGMDRIVDTEKYLAHHSLKINTGKAGKDFAFSEDDTTIVSLDKAGRVKFWDIRSLTKPELVGNPAQPQQIEIKDPLITLTTTPASEKSWPTSVLLVDKLRPYQRGCALRYLIVGMKQNHTLQLWDLALQKPVQEIHLPHQKESDAVCSVLYHAATSIIVVGHPTRNSIYFLHLSAPKYNLPKSVTQADFMAKLVSKDPSLPSPESTAVISGMREYSLANKGTLRSIDILQTPNSTAAGDDPQTFFELYAMHSKGVTCLNIKQADLGWDSNNKVVNNIDGKESGMIAIEVLKELPVTPAPEVNEPVNPQTPFPTRIVSRPKETSVKESPKKMTVADVVPQRDETTDRKDVPATNGAVPAVGKKNRRKANSSAEQSNNTPISAAQSSKPIIMDPSSNTRNGNISKANAKSVPTSEINISSSTDFSEAALKNIETRVAGEVKKLFGDSLDSLLLSIKEDRRTQSALADSRQETLLSLVSATLSDNIEASLGRIVDASIEKSVLPALADVSSQAVNEQLGASLSSHLAQSIPRELQKLLPDAISKSLQQPQLLKLMSESLAKSVAFRVEEQFAVLLETVVAPAFTNLAVKTSQQVATDVRREAGHVVEAVQLQRQADSVKIDQLTQLVTGLSQTVSSMATAQTEFQGQFLKMQQQAAVDRREAALRQIEGHGHASHTSVSRSSTAPTNLIEEKSVAEVEYETMLNSITTAMNDAAFESAVIQWLQTNREQEFFRKYFSKFNPEFIRDLSPLLLLSLGATITIETNDNLLRERVTWLEVIVTAFTEHVSNVNMEIQVRELIPKIMGIYIQRLEHLFMRVTQHSAHDPLLKRISNLVGNCNRILEINHSLVPQRPLPASITGSARHGL